MSATSSNRRVGVPVAEALLVDEFVAAVPKLFPPGAGRSAWVLREVELGAGIPDVAVLVASAAAVRSWASTGLRIPSLAAARVLAGQSTSQSLGISPEYADRVKKLLVAQGWTESAFRRAGSLIVEALGIEAKISDYSRAIVQANRFSSYFHSTAVLYPASATARLPLDIYELNGIGVIAKEPAGYRWVLDASRAEVEPAKKVWLAELLIRQLERAV